MKMSLRTIAGQSRFCLRWAGLALALGMAVPAGAQNVDPQLLLSNPELLQQLQNKKQGGAPMLPSPVDQARDRAGNTALDPAGPEALNDYPYVFGPDGRLINLDKGLNRPASPIEKDFARRLGDNQLRQFGYDLFRFGATTKQGISGRVDDSYLVGIGDEFVITFQGPQSRSLTTRVDSEGRVVVDQLRPVPAAGRSFGAVRRDIELATQSAMIGTRVFVSIGSARTISVFVGGEVERPRQVTLNSFADITAALASAGGIKQSGSLRSVQILRGGRRFTVDLYPLLGIGTANLQRVQDGDRIIVPLVGPVIAVGGAVKRPAIFELRPGGGQSVRDAVGLAGGPLRPGGNDFLLSRIARDGTEKITTSQDLGGSVQSGDLVQVVAREALAEGVVDLSGYATNPGPRSLGIAPNLTALVGGYENLRPLTYVSMAVISRVDPVTKARKLQAVNLLDMLRGKSVPLYNYDRVVLFRDDEIQFINSDIVRNIILGQANALPQCRSLDLLTQIVRSTQSNRFASAVRSNLAVRRATGFRTAHSVATSNEFGVTTPAALPENNPSAANLACPSSFEGEPGILPFVLEHVVSVSGNVRRPGPYPIASPISLETLAAVAEGIWQDSKTSKAEITRASSLDEADAAMTRETVAQDAFASTMIHPGDSVRFGTESDRFEPGAILLTGEFTNPGLYTIRKGESLSEVIRRAGGLTEHAYPYGAVFTRRSVAQAQEESFRRTSRELNAALLVASTGKEVSGEAIAAGAKLSETLASVEAPGRVVVEADPKVLERRSDLETVLEPGDALYIPKRPNYVMAVGDLLNPTALQFVPNKSVQNYLEETGGFQRTADKKRTYLVLPNGTALPARRGSWWRTTRDHVVPPGSVIVAPKDLDPLRNLNIVKDFSQIFSQLAVSLASVAVLSRGGN